MTLPTDPSLKWLLRYRYKITDISTTKTATSRMTIFNYLQDIPWWKGFYCMPEIQQDRRKYRLTIVPFPYSDCILT